MGYKATQYLKYSTKILNQRYLLNFQISWLLKGRPIDESIDSFGESISKSLDRRKENLLDKSLVNRGSSSRIADVTITSLSYHGNIEESTVHIHKISEVHSGEWTCAVGQLQEKSIKIFVITSNSKVQITFK